MNTKMNFKDFFKKFGIEGIKTVTYNYKNGFLNNQKEIHFFTFYFSNKTILSFFNDFFTSITL